MGSEIHDVSVCLLHSSCDNDNYWILSSGELFIQTLGVSLFFFHKYSMLEDHLGSGPHTECRNRPGTFTARAIIFRLP